MLVPGGGFAASYDADFEGEEGKFYVWTAAEITRCARQWRAGRHLRASLRRNRRRQLGRQDHPQPPQCSGASQPRRGASLSINAARSSSRLREKRKSRAGTIRCSPTGTASPSGQSRKPETSSAIRMDRARRKGLQLRRGQWSATAGLFHSFRHGKLKAPATSADYANMISAALALPSHRRKTLSRRCHRLDRNHEPPLQRGQWRLLPCGGRHERSYLAAAFGKRRRRSQSERNHAAEPRRSLYSHRRRSVSCAGPMGSSRRSKAQLKRWPSPTPAFCPAPLPDCHLSTSSLPAIRSSEDAAAWRKALTEVSLPDALVQWVEDGDAIPASSPAAGKGRIDGKTTAYVCIGQRCSMPLTEPDALKEELKEERSCHRASGGLPI